ncbi:T9SS type A sorting domain-containing protein [Calditrichota bacterium]
MKKGLLQLGFICLIAFALPMQGQAQLSADPFGISIVAENGDSTIYEITLTNNSEQEVTAEIGFSGVDREEEGRGPRRDELDGIFALFQDTNAWGWVNDAVFETIDDVEWDYYSSADDLEEVDLGDYDALWIVVGDQSQDFINTFDDNLGRFEDYVDGGGVIFFEEGWNSRSVAELPGGLTEERVPQEGNLAVGPEDNWMIEQMGFEDGQYFRCGNTTHVTYSEDDIADIENSDWYQIIMVGDQTGEPCEIIYSYGRGYVLVSGQPSSHVWNNYAGEGGWGSRKEALLEWMLMLSKPSWVFSNPELVELDAGEDTVVELILNPIELDDGIYELLVDFDLTYADESFGLYQMAVVMSIGSPVGNLGGAITDAATDEAIEGAWVTMDYFEMGRFTDAEGMYSMTDLPLNEYAITVSAPDFHDSTAVVDMDAEEDFTLDFSLLHAEFMPSVEALAVEMDADSMTQMQFTVTNEGNGPLSYSISKQLAGEANFEPWDLRENDNYAEVTGDPRLSALEYVDGLWYVGGGNADPNQIFVLNEDGELVDQFDQIGTARRGMPDITWDGEHFWGSGDEMVYQFNADGTHDSVSFEGPYNPTKGIAWDSDRELLWLCSTTRDIVGYDRDGNFDEANTLDRMDFRLITLEYWSDDPDGYQLYMTHDIDGTTYLHKMNIETNDTMFVKLWTEDEGELGGFVITSNYDPYNVVLASMFNLPDGDELQIWQYRARDSWFSISPTMGVINPAVEDTFTVTFDSEGLPEDIFTGEFVFSHDAVGSENIITAELTVALPEIPNDPPSEFSLVSPADGDTIYPHLVNEIEFSWTASVDPDTIDNVIYQVTFMSGELMAGIMHTDTSLIVNMYDVLDSLDLGGDFVEPVIVSWYVDAMSGEDVVMSNETFEFTVWPPDYAGDVEEGLPLSFELQSLYPNPFNSTTTLKYAVDHDRAVSVVMFDMNGREIYSRVLGNQAPGYHTHTIQADHLPSGLYIVRLTSGADVKLAKVALMR